MNKFRHFYIDIYGINLYFIRCKREYFIKKFNKTFNKDVSPTGDACFCHVDQNDRGVVWVEKDEQVAHEVFHAVAWIMRQVEVDLCYASEEAYAYLQDYIIRLIRKMK